jgi:hypothetical protein
VVEGAVSLLDLAPTLTEMTGAHSLPGAEGVSLNKTLRSGVVESNRKIISMLLDTRCGPACMIRSNKGCRIHHARFPDENWGDDPGPLPANWEDERMEQILTTIAARSKIHRKAVQNSGEPLHERWQVDPRQLKVGRDH